MTTNFVADPRSTALEAARVPAGISVYRRWIDYFALGGSLPPTDVEVLLSGDLPVGDHDHDVLVHALNERFAARGEKRRLVYADELTAGATRSA